MKITFSAPFKFAILAATTSCLAACGGDKGGAPAETSTTSSATQNQINPVPRGQVADGGRFTWPLHIYPANYNYGHLDGTGLDAMRVYGALMPTAFTTDAGGTPIWNRDYLASEPIVTTSPKQIITFSINPKAIWYDGTPITWEDFHWQWKSNNGSDQRYQVSSIAGYEDIESVERGKDDHEVVVTFKRLFADWTSLFYFMYPASTNKDPKIFNEGWKERPLTTAGPFKVASIDRTSQTITLVRNERWWGEPAKLDTIVFRGISPEAQIDAFANGEVDAMDIPPNPNAYSRAKQIPTADLRTAGGPNFRHITINGLSSVLQDVSVRRAVALGIDRATIARALLTPLDIPPKSLENHIFMANQAGFKVNSGELGQANPEKAKQLLDEAGWKLDGAIRKKDGKPLEITIVIPAGVAESKQEAELIQNMLGGIGVTVRINAVPRNELFSKYVTPGQFELTIFSWIGSAYPVSSAKPIYGQPVRKSDNTLDVRQNYARIGSAAIDSLLSLANMELDRGKAAELANRADSLIWSEVHSLPMYQRPEIIAAEKNLANFGAFGFAAPWVYQNIGWIKQR